MKSTIFLAQELIAIDTVNPPGNELQCARLVADYLASDVCEVAIVEHWPGRASLIADWRGSDEALAPLVFTGHFDTVPLGSAAWAVDPHGAAIVGDRLYGRGASDMKAAIAAMVTACVRATGKRNLRRGVKLVLTAGEETGCDGARALVEQQREALGNASGLVVGEPTSNRLVLGHKGALWLAATVQGATAHASMPELGENAIYSAMEAVNALRAHPLAHARGLDPDASTLSVTTFDAGQNVNSIPDTAHFTLDVRSAPGASHDMLKEEISETLGDMVAIRSLIDVPPVRSTSDAPFVVAARRALGLSASDGPQVSYFSDAALLVPHYGCPAVILGPGDPEQAHQTDEHCSLSAIAEAEAIYTRLIKLWCE